MTLCKNEEFQGSVKSVHQLKIAWSVKVQLTFQIVKYQMLDIHCNVKCVKTAALKSTITAKRHGMGTYAAVSIRESLRRKARTVSCLNMS